MKHILVGLDYGSDAEAESVVEWVEQFAIDVGAAVTIAHIVPRSTLLVISGMQLDSTSYVRSVRKHFNRMVIDRLRAAGVHADLRVVRGDAARELANVAEQEHAELIVVGGPDHSAWHDVFWGGMARRLEHHTPLPVVIVPTRAPLAAARG